MLTLQLRYRITIRDARGRVVRRTRWRRSRSYVKQMTQMYLACFSLVNEAGVVDTAGASRILKAAQTNKLRADAEIANDDYGPVVGTGSTAVDISDNALGSQIAHGTGSGQLQYRGTEFGSHLVSGQTSHFTLARIFLNSSGAEITINEVGIYFNFQDSAFAERYFLGARDVVPGGELVGNGQSATLEYLIGVTA